MTEEEREEWKEQLIDATEDYADLLSQKNYGREKFNLLTRSFLEDGVTLQTIVESFPIIFDLDNAAGAQLDILGETLGISRMLPYVPTVGSKEMDDEEYRLMIRLKIARNIWDGSNGNANQIYREHFDNTGIHINQIDNQDMSVDVDVYGDSATRQAEILRNTNSLLIPVCVGTNIVLIGDEVNADIYTTAVQSGYVMVESVEAT